MNFKTLTTAKFFFEGIPLCLCAFVAQNLFGRRPDPLLRKIFISHEDTKALRNTEIGFNECT